MLNVHKPHSTIVHNSTVAIVVRHKVVQPGARETPPNLSSARHRQLSSLFALGQRRFLSRRRQSPRSVASQLCKARSHRQGRLLLYQTARYFQRRGHLIIVKGVHIRNQPSQISDLVRNADNPLGVLIKGDSQLFVAASGPPTPKRGCQIS